tara:strand:- start:587 stop:835 length:249 start_codon:yes stop_codon:yes gene_type:complete
MAVNVYLWSSLARFTDNKTELLIEAATVGELIDRLILEYPELARFFNRGFSIAINGEISNPQISDVLPQGSEIYVMQQLKGG